MSYSLHIAQNYGNAVAVAKGIDDRITEENMKYVVVTTPCQSQIVQWQAVVMEPIWGKYESIIGRSIVDAALQPSTNQLSAR